MIYKRRAMPPIAQALNVEIANARRRRSKIGNALFEAQNRKKITQLP